MDRYDVCILGGGLAGLSLGIQLRQTLPALRIVVLERRQHPVREAAFKVGESSAEVGSYYFAERLGLKKHIQEKQLPKLGLRYFFGADDNRDISRRVEFGGNVFLPTPTYQLDRGRFENFLGEEARRLGIEFLDGTHVKQLDLDRERGHRVTCKNHSDEEQTIGSRWIVDASGRASLLKRRNQLDQPNRHVANAIWFRIGDRIKIDDWSNNAPWLDRARSQGGERWLSTNHLMGPGYWVWLIPLSSGSTSVGIVCDAGLHEYQSMNSFQKAIAWLERHEPQCAEIIRRRQDNVMDFIGFQDYSYECKQVFSTDRWCLTGEAGVFLDPLYSPGSDFIAFGNTFVAELIRNDLAGEDITVRTKLFNDIYMRFFRRQMTVYEGQYGILGNPRIMPLKILWDFAFYWSVPAFIFFKDKLCDLHMYVACESMLGEVDEVNREMQSLFREWSELAEQPLENRFIDAAQIPYIVDLNKRLMEPIPDEAFAVALEANIRELKLAAMELKAIGSELIGQAGRYPAQTATNRFAEIQRQLSE